MISKVGLLFTTLMLIIGFTAGCSQDPVSVSNSQSQQKAEAEHTAAPPAPVTLKLYVEYGSFSDDELTAYFLNPVRQKYPYITIDIVKSDKPATYIQNAVLTNSVPDLIFTTSVQMGKYIEEKVALDLKPLIKKNNTDLSKIYPVVIDSIQAHSDSVEMYALPFVMQVDALYYNKDLFDRFATAYPQDGMTWDQTIELAKRLAREDNGVKYRALDVQNMAPHFGGTLSLPYVDEKTNQPVLNTDGWKKAFQMFQQIHSIPFNESYAAAGKAFVNDQNLVMYANYGGTLSTLEQLEQKGKAFNWDVVTFPHHPQFPKYGKHFNAQVTLISSTSQHIEDAYKVAALLLDKEVQTLAMKNARRSVLDDASLNPYFGEILKSLKGKNVKAFFNDVPAPAVPATKYDEEMWKIVNGATKRVVDQGVDVNTALREAQEAASTYLKSQ
jgi:multiple sugar transport system substrate-binding protein